MIDQQNFSIFVRRRKDRPKVNDEIRSSMSDKERVGFALFEGTDGFCFSDTS